LGRKQQAKESLWNGGQKSAIGSSERLAADPIRYMNVMAAIFPDMIREAIAASLRDIALAFLAHDESQIEYYTEITKRMPGPG
jgi:hypothetical protein